MKSPASPHEIGSKLDEYPADIRRVVERETDGETVYWTDQPIPKAYARRMTGAQIVGVLGSGSLLVAAIGLAAKNEGWFVALFGVALFLVIGLLVSSAPLWGVWVAKHTFYVVTDRRVICFTSLFRCRVAWSVPIADCIDAVRWTWQGGNGTITLPDERVAEDAPPREIRCVARVREVFELLRSLASKEQPRSSSSC